VSPVDDLVIKFIPAFSNNSFVISLFTNRNQAIGCQYLKYTLVKPFLQSYSLMLKIKKYNSNIKDRESTATLPAAGLFGVRADRHPDDQSKMVFALCDPSTWFPAVPVSCRSAPFPAACPRRLFGNLVKAMGIGGPHRWSGFP
jgi:hypothetical protein